MKFRQTLLLLCLLTCGVAMAQTSGSFRVKGVVLDSLTQEGEPYATVKIAKKNKPEKAVKAVLTDINGAFSATVNGQGDFLLTISSMGREPLVREFASGKEVDLGTLYITDAANELAEVVVTAQKPLVKADMPTTPTRRPTPCWRCSARCRWSLWTARTTSR